MIKSGRQEEKKLNKSRYLKFELRSNINVNVCHEELISYHTSRGLRFCTVALYARSVCIVYDIVGEIMEQV